MIASREYILDVIKPKLRDNKNKTDIYKIFKILKVTPRIGGPYLFYKYIEYDTKHIIVKLVSYKEME